MGLKKGAGRGVRGARPSPVGFSCTSDLSAEVQRVAPLRRFAFGAERL
jgi:hypothetical protein